MSRIYASADEIGARLGVNRKKASQLAAERVIVSVETGANKRKRYYTSETLISHAEKLIKNKYGEAEDSSKSPFNIAGLSSDIYKQKNKDSIVITVANQKGGVGKTTTAANLATALSKMGQRVLLTDMDSQAQSSKYFRKIEYNGVSIMELFEKYRIDNKITYDEVKERIVTLSIDEYDNTIDLLPSEVRLTRMLEIMRMCMRPETILDEILNRVKTDYDFIIIDTPPSASLSLQMGIYAADKIALVTEATEFSITPLEATIEEIKMLNASVEKNIAIDAIIVNQYKERETIQKNTMEDIVGLLVYKLDFGVDNLYVLKYASSVIENSQSLQLPIIAYKKNVKDAITISDPIFKYASRLIIDNLTTTVVIKEK